jgi:hypothetical protein
MVSEPFLLQDSTMAMMPNTTPSSTTTIPFALAIPLTEKLTKANYLLWHA